MNRALKIALLCVILPSIALSDTPRPLTPQERCDLAIKAANEVIKAQDMAISNLKKNLNTTQDKLAEATRPPTIPTWVWIAIGVGAGAAAGAAIAR